MFYCIHKILLIYIARYTRRSVRFMDAYQRGLDGKQAAWANKKYRGHRVLPDSLMKDMDDLILLFTRTYLYNRSTLILVPNDDACG